MKITPQRLAELESGYGPSVDEVRALCRLARLFALARAEISAHRTIIDVRDYWIDLQRDINATEKDYQRVGAVMFLTRDDYYKARAALDAAEKEGA